METQQLDAAEVYRSIAMVHLNIGRLEGILYQVAGRLDRVEQRLDRLIFALFAFGGAMGAALAAIIVKLFLGS